MLVYVQYNIPYDYASSSSFQVLVLTAILGRLLHLDPVSNPVYANK